MKNLVTGGAGFIGSHIVDKLLESGEEVIVYDNLSTGRMSYIAHHQENPRFAFVKADLLDKETLQAQMHGIDRVFHFAANADVKGGIANRDIDLTQNLLATKNVLDAMHSNGTKKIAFASTAVIYGEPTVFPTPETYMPTQTSLYGASKIAAESWIQAYCAYDGMQSWIFRFVSWIGERYSHGVIFDFAKKLNNNPSALDILGDGKQVKSYLDVSDGVAGIFLALEKMQGPVNIINLGHQEQMDVDTLSDIVIDEMGLPGVKKRYAGGARGWIGDSPLVHLDNSRLMQHGWSPKKSIEQGVRETVRYLRQHPDLFRRDESNENKQKNYFPTPS